MIPFGKICSFNGFSQEGTRLHGEASWGSQPQMTVLGPSERALGSPRAGSPDGWGLESASLVNHYHLLASHHLVLPLK